LRWRAIAGGIEAEANGFGNHQAQPPIRAVPNGPKSPALAARIKKTLVLLGLAVTFAATSERGLLARPAPRQHRQLEYEAGTDFLSGSRLSLGTARLGNVGLQDTGNSSLHNHLSLGVNASPGICSDFLDIGWGDVNIPFNLVLAWQADEHLMWLLGMYADLRSEFHASDDLLLHGGAEWRQVAYRVVRDLGTKTAFPALNNAILDDRELRMGAGLNHSFSRHLNLNFEGSYSV
jgi:hypothetical protein